MALLGFNILAFRYLEKLGDDDTELEWDSKSKEHFLRMRFVDVFAVFHS